jgi:PTH1 family peptidyl-tRNA hydrolase
VKLKLKLKRNNRASLLVLGLGNPGERYSRTRHNVGFLAIERISQKLGITVRKGFLRNYAIGSGSIGPNSLYLAKPLTFMNNSGAVIASLFKRTRLTTEKLLIICDNMDLPPGKIRLKRKGSPTASHNGISSIMKYSGTGCFLRIYIGIGRPEKKGDIIPYVLSNPPAAEDELYDRALEIAAESVISLLSKPVDQVMHEINRRNP